MIQKLLIIIVVCILLAGCNNEHQINEARKMSDKLLDDIASGKALSSFPVKYFPLEKSRFLLEKLRTDCDFANRKGRFINDFYAWESGHRSASFIYEYYLKCDSIRIITTYNLGDKIELYGFRMESIEKDNFMITKPERRLKY